jgi:hypothetical protein
MNLKVLANFGLPPSGDGNASTISGGAFTHSRHMPKPDRIPWKALADRRLGRNFMGGKQLKFGDWAKSATPNPVACREQCQN